MPYSYVAVSGRVHTFSMYALFTIVDYNYSNDAINKHMYDYYFIVIFLLMFVIKL